MHYYGKLLAGFLVLFIPMIQSTGGNSSSQSSALAIQGISSGEINDANIASLFTPGNGNGRNYWRNSCVSVLFPGLFTPYAHIFLPTLR